MSAIVVITIVIVIIIIMVTLIGAGFRLKTDPAIVQDTGMAEIKN